MMIIESLLIGIIIGTIGALWIIISEVVQKRKKDGEPEDEPLRQSPSVDDASDLHNELSALVTMKAIHDGLQSCMEKEDRQASHEDDDDGFWDSYGDRH